MEPRNLTKALSDDDLFDLGSLPNSPFQPELIARIDPNDVSCYKEIARGAFATVYLGEYNKKTVAVKSIKKTNTKGEDVSEYWLDKELKSNIALAKNYSVNIVKCFGYVLSPYRKFLIFEYFEKGSLFDFIIDTTPGQFSWQSRLTIMRDISQAVKFIHGSGWLHNDIKPDNVLLTVDGHAKICDFGLACQMSENKPRQIGTPGYMAPELNEKGPSTASDIYSMGIVFGNIKECDVMNSVIGMLPKLTDKPPVLFALVQTMWKKDPGKRPTIDTVISELDSAELKKQLGP